MRPLFTQEPVAASAEFFLDGLLGEERRKTGWMRAEAAGDPGPWRQQAIVGRRRWSADELRDIVRGYALATLADDDAVLVIDETGFLKQGKASCGVARQCLSPRKRGSACSPAAYRGMVVLLSERTFIVSGKRSLRSLYLPKAWTDDPIRMTAAHVLPAVVSVWIDA